MTRARDFLTRFDAQTKFLVLLQCTDTPNFNIRLLMDRVKI